MTPPAPRLSGNPASAIYGTILAASQLAVQSASTHSTLKIIASLAGTAFIFWLAHAYADTLGTTLASHSARPPSFRHALRAEWPIIEAAVVPALTLLAFVAAGAEPSTAAAAALIAANLELIGWALLAARRTGLTGLRRVGAAVVAATFGIALIALKFWIH